MFRAILETQWKASRLVLLLGSVVAFALPVMAVNDAALALEQLDARGVIAEMREVGSLYALAACGTGLVLAMITWSSDHAGRHVYALSLPVERWRYVAMRFGAGTVLLAAPAIALALGSAVALAGVNVPAGLRTYPVALTVRFALALILAYAIFFGISSMTRRTAAYLIAAVAGLVAVEVFGVVAGVQHAGISLVLDLAASGVGIFHVFTGRWMLIDV